MMEFEDVNESNVTDLLQYLRDERLSRGDDNDEEQQIHQM